MNPAHVQNVRRIRSSINMTDVEITSEDWESYRDVQNSGAFNMLSPDAILMSGLSDEKYTYILSNYGDLAKKFENGA